MSFFSVFLVRADPGETIILDTAINHQAVGQQFYFLRPDGELLVPPDTLQVLRLKIPPGATEGQDLSFQAFTSGLRYEFNEQQASLQLDADPTLFALQTLSKATAAKRASRIPLRWSRSVLFNYRSSALWEEKRGFHSVDIPFEVAWQLGEKERQYGNLFANFSTRYRQGEGTQLKRIQTQWVYDDPDKMRRLIIGDYVGRGHFGGLSLEKRFSLQPNFRSFPSLDLFLANPLPATAELHIDGILVETWQITPGEVIFNDVISHSGQGEATLIIRDILGNEHQYITPYFIGTEFLQTGLAEYALQFGFQRKALGMRNFRYGKPEFNGFYRLGVNKSFTAGLDLSWNEARIILGTQFLLSLQGHILVALRPMFSKQDGKSGYGLRSSLQYQQKRIRLFLETEHDQASFSQFSEAGQTKNTLKSSIRLGTTLSFGARWGSLSLEMGERRRFDEDAIQREQLLNYQKRLSSHVDLLLTARKIKGNVAREEFFVSLQYHQQARPDIAYNWRQEGETARHQLSVGTPLSRAQGNFYRLRLQQEASGESDWRGDLRHSGNHAEFNLGYQHLNAVDAADLGIAGSLAWVAGSDLLLGRPILDSFAIVQTQQADIPVRLSGQIMGTTDHNGQLLIPDIVSWVENRIEISVDDLPLDFTLDHSMEILRVGPRSGSLATFSISAYQGIEAKIYRLLEGVAQPVENAIIQIDTGAERRTISLGKEGYLYVENLPAKHYPAKVSLEQGDTCDLTLVVPSSEQVIINLGILYCEKTP